MIKHKIAGIIILLVIGLWPVALSAAGFSRSLSFPLGGRVTMTREDLQTEIVCTASYGPFMLFPFNTAIPGPHFIRSATNGIPKRSGYFLGNYMTVPDVGTCVNPVTGIPVTAYEIKIYGVSR